jgi:HSP20 family molecular chaperone IbpA
MTQENTTLTRSQATSLDQPEELQVVTITPRVDIYENQDEILVVADFPGVPKESVSVRLDRSELVIEGTQAVPEGQRDAQPLAFSRTFRVPNTVEPNGVSAELSQGVLQVHLAKSEAARPKRIEVRSS